MIGKEILGYTVDEKIGAGGFGTVYKVSKTNAAGTYVRALKHVTLPSKKQYASVLASMGGDYAKADDYFSGVLSDILGEIRILSTLSESGTQNIVRYYENDIIETQSPKTYEVYILMEYLTPFPDYYESKQFTVKEAIRLGKDILAALISCHGKNIIHRDIKDDNIFVSSEGIYKLGDFGVSKALKDKTRAESVKGTPNFIAPEVYLGKEKYDNTVDLYSLGIVLYKLLNKSRVPFLPEFPATYSTEDEDLAFEARMTGKTPDLPVCAKNALGEAVLKAIMPREQRYSSANEFLEALQRAEESLSEAELSEVLNTVSSVGTLQKTVNSVDVRNNHFDETVGWDCGSSSREVTVDTGSDKHLFDTISTPAPVQPSVERSTTPQAEYPKREKNDTDFNRSGGYRATSQGDTVRVDEPPRVAAVAKKDMKWMIYLSPLAIIAIYLITYLIVIPLAFGKAVTLVDWLFNDPEKIVQALKTPSNVLVPIFTVVGLKIFNWILSVAFIASLFFVGHTLHNKKPAISIDAKLIGKEAYLTAMELYEQIKLVSSCDVGAAKNAMYSVCERLKNESNFGSGNASVINCENDIANCLKAIEGNIAGLSDERTAGQSTENIKTLCQRILGKLKIRIELKKK